MQTAMKKKEKKKKLVCRIVWYGEFYADTDDGLRRAAMLKNPRSRSPIYSFKRFAICHHFGTTSYS
jgi:hypothetical protein